MPDPIRDFIAASRARCEAATKGPWVAQKPRYNKQGRSYRAPVTSKTVPQCAVCTTFQSESRWDYKHFASGVVPIPANGLFIAHARTDLPRALEALEVMRDALETIVGETGDETSGIQADEALMAVGRILAGVGE